MNRILSLLTLAAFLSVGAPALAQYATESGPFAGEPTVEEAIEAATRRFHVRVEDMDRYRRRVGVSALLPHVDVTYRTNDSTLDLDHFDALNFPGDDPASIDDGSASVNEIQINAGWDLSRVVFNPLVLDVTAMAGLYDEIAEEVINVYFLRQRLVLSMVNNPPGDTGTRQTMELRIAQATATLNSLTGGIFE
jgi:hypothetical protein